MLEELGNEQMPEWEVKMLQEQGFSEMGLPHLKRKKSEADEYFVYSTKTEFKTVEAETAILAIEKEGIKPYKVVPAHRRIEDVLNKENVEYVEEKTDLGVKEGEAAGQPAEASSADPKPAPEAEAPPA